MTDASPRRRGQVGVETLIVFAAMIVVAALGATLLISTAGMLQNTAEATSEDSSAQVSDQILVVGATGTIDVDGGDRTVDGVNLTVTTSPGAGEIDLSGASIELVGATRQRTLGYGETADAGSFAVEPLVDDDASAPVLNDRSDRFSIRISLDGDARLEPGERATIRVVGAGGSVQTKIVGAPQSLRSYEEGDDVAL
ncbi:archaellin/type IV pilin N-terminal domain-containing protein [Natronoarchaeum mannanilyticum]|uniref:archaellin/type IV pilin N-terminal domain-containing protein n=1 Tax=Natronoarchaeum mannanilyticum TaxID=926360 RepID=UPI0031D5C1CA